MTKYVYELVHNPSLLVDSLEAEIGNYLHFEKGRASHEYTIRAANGDWRCDVYNDEALEEINKIGVTQKPPIADTILKIHPDKPNAWLLRDDIDPRAGHMNADLLFSDHGGTMH